MPGTVTVNDGATTVTSKSPMSEVTKVAAARTDADAFGTEESSAPVEQASEQTGEVEKTQAEEQQPEANTEETQEGTEQELQQLESEGKPIPFDRFKKVIGERNKTRDALKKLEADYSEAAKMLNDPDVLPVVLKKLGYSDDKIAETLKERGLEQAKEEAKGKEQYDLATVEGWDKYIADKINQGVDSALKKYDAQRMTKEQAERFVSDNQTQAQSLAKDLYNIPYGKPGTDDVKKNPETALGKMALYLDKHPEDAYLGHAKILRLAMSEEGFKLGEQKGVEKEKKRVEQVKKAALEGDETSKGGNTPNSKWSVQQIMEWRRSHPNVEI